MISLVILSLSVSLVSSASNMVFKKIDVEMGPVGSDDDIRHKKTYFNLLSITLPGVPEKMFLSKQGSLLTKGTFF